MEQPIVCIITDNPRWKRELERALGGSFTLSFVRNFKEATSFVKKQLIGCIIVPGSINKTEDLVPIKKFKNHFPEIPLVIYGKVASKELAHQLGKLGVEFINDDNAERLAERVQPIIEQRSFCLDFKEFGIVVEQCPLSVRKALKLIAKDFSRLKTVAEIADKLNISVSYFEREFTRSCNLSCKKLLLGIRLYYATYLTEKKKWSSLKQIALECHFTDPHEFYRLFRKTTGVTASFYRQNYRSEEFPKIFINLQRKKL